MKKIKIVIGYPPLDSKLGTPLLSQNRQFQYFNSPTYIYPMVPAYLATMLKKNGYSVYWLDGIAERWTFSKWITKLKKIKPDYLILETKTPVIKQHWKIINSLSSDVLSKKTTSDVTQTNSNKSRLSHVGRGLTRLTTILVGDHITYLPYESFQNSLVDYVVTGGDYDFVITNLINHLHKKEKLEGGVYWRSNNKKIKTKPLTIKKIGAHLKICSSGPASLKHNLDKLPFVDRNLTRWQLYAYKNGNYKYFPGTYLYSGRDCWWGKCTFCIWDHTLSPLGSYRTMSPERIFSEVKYLIDKFKVKEIFDDAGTFMIGPRLKKFCQLMIDSQYSKKVKIGCNMRFNALKKEDYLLMKQAGFRFILYGMESANQQTLNKIRKGIKVADIEKGAKAASQAGLDVHATVMLGYPWETYSQAKKTIELTKKLFKKGYFNTMQATIIIPYPGSSLWQEAKNKGWLLTEDYDDYDMRRTVMKIPFSQAQLLKLTRELYTTFLSSEYLVRKIKSIRSVDDLNFFIIAGKKLIGHLLDFGNR